MKLFLKYNEKEKKEKIQREKIKHNSNERYSLEFHEYMVYVQIKPNLKDTNGLKSLHFFTLHYYRNGHIMIF